MRSAETGVKNSSRLKSGWMILDGEVSWCHLMRRFRHSIRWRDGRAHWHGSLHNVANERCSLHDHLPTTPSHSDWLVYSKPVLFLLVLLYYIIGGFSRYRY